MTAKTKELVLFALRSIKSDDYERAKRAFSNFTHVQMQQEWGQSGHTCREILDGYQAETLKIDAAIREIHNTETKG